MLAISVLAFLYLLLKSCYLPWAEWNLQECFAHILQLSPETKSEGKFTPMSVSVTGELQFVLASWLALGWCSLALQCSTSDNKRNWKIISLCTFGGVLLLFPLVLWTSSLHDKSAQSIRIWKGWDQAACPWCQLLWNCSCRWTLLPAV